MLDNKNIVIGYGGHAYVVIESYLKKGGILGYYADLNENIFNPFNLIYLGSERDINFNGWQMSVNFILGIGDNRIREKAGNFILNKKKMIENVIDSNAIVSKSISIGNGVFISKGVLVNAFSKIGNYAILNSGCIIEHECEIGIAAHIAPGAVLAGNVKIGQRAFIGANSVIKQGVEIGDDVIIGAGAVVLHNVKNNSKIVGNPGRLI